ncbi:MAG: type III-A CRISPR-associated RAMP protein Csm5 [Chloroflexaceae bacterium]|nr:type III-A CRISPR-associated RAMP protein Csm5 [Chloroflexaceae bacterium]
MTTYSLTVTTLSPLHIGSGGPPLARGVDFVVYGKTLYVFDTTQVLDHLAGPQFDTALIDQVMKAQNLTTFLSEETFHTHPHLVHYCLHGTSSVVELIPHLKDISGRPYIPGSSLKGALRTAIIDESLLAQNRPVEVRQLGNQARFAGQHLERAVVGQGEKSWLISNYDLFRSLHLADSAPISPEHLSLSAVAVYPESERDRQALPLNIETIRAGSTFRTTLTIDDYLFGKQSRKLGFGQRRHLIENFARTCRAHAQAHLEQEQAFFARQEVPMLRYFYGGLADQLARCGPGSFLLSLGWGTGWKSKTLERTIRATEGALSDIIKHYRLNRGRTPAHERDFPTTRHLMVEQQQPVGPLGWVRIDVEVAERPATRRMGRAG